MHDTPDIRIPAQRWPEPEHQLWCTDHLGDDAGFGMCIGTDLELPGLQIGLRWEPGRPVYASVATGVRVEEISLDDLEHRALAMLTTALMGRGMTPPATALTGTVTA
ncbi:hypothetical protein [Nonomuraea sp. SYSU D8015]|uniref:hypothetical protein n=1 Tax=Nonomuraea sp. SYSU D8015 TaxID=2593644 RepID=UPI0016609766|nr:hypothetical protein [Nonomuraea sp. SYSU D8015]